MSDEEAKAPLEVWETVFFKDMTGLGQCLVGALLPCWTFQVVQSLFQLLVFVTSFGMSQVGGGSGERSPLITAFGVLGGVAALVTSTYGPRRALCMPTVKKCRPAFTH